MDVHFFVSVFMAVFLGELGDKTQLVTVAASASSNKPLLVFIASASALITASAMGVAIGSVIGTAINIKFLKIGSGILFITIGLWTLYDALS